MTNGNNHYLVEHIEWLKNNYRRFRNGSALVDEFKREFGFGGKSCIKQILARNGWHIMPYTLEEENWMKENVSRLSEREFCEKFNERFGCNVNQSTTKCRIRKLGYRFSDYEHSTKLRKQIHGSPIGNIVVHRGLEYIKVRDDFISRKDGNMRNYRSRACVEYERLNGISLEEKDIVIFLDGDKRNYSKENLMRVSRKCIPKMANFGKLSDRSIEENRTIAMICQLEIMAKEED